METFKLYHRDAGYKCRVNHKEIYFLFGIAEGLTFDEINAELAQTQTGYYITL